MTETTPHSYAEGKLAEMQGRITRLEGFLECYSEFAHSLRNSLAVIHGAGQLLMGSEAADARHFGELVYGETTRLSGLTQDLLELTRLETGRLRLNRCWIDTSALIKGTVSEVTPLANKTPIELKVPAFIGPIYVDAGYLQRILKELLLLAATRSPEGSPVRLEVQVTDGDSPGICFAIRDQGPVISEERCARFFEPFGEEPFPLPKRRCDTTGLAICKGIVEAHGGEIDVHSGTDGYTTFIVSLPNQPVQMDSTEALSQEKSP